MSLMRFGNGSQKSAVNPIPPARSELSEFFRHLASDGRRPAVRENHLKTKELKDELRKLEVLRQFRIVGLGFILKNERKELGTKFSVYFGAVLAASFAAPMPEVIIPGVCIGAGFCFADLRKFGKLKKATLGAIQASEAEIERRRGEAFRRYGELIRA